MKYISGTRATSGIQIKEVDHKGREPHGNRILAAKSTIGVMICKIQNGAQTTAEGLSERRA